MLNFTDIDFNAVWQETFGWNTADDSSRKFNDQIEQAFWDKLAPRYTREYNLNHDTGLIAARLEALLGHNKSILELGCGSGNFTMLMAAYSKHILGLEFAPAMLAELQKRIAAAAAVNISTQVGKWENFTSAAPFDYIVSVNSLYRIRSIESALQKMHAYSRQGFIIVRTIQRPFFYGLYQELGLCCPECLDYQLLPLLLWRNGLQANVEFLTYGKTRQFTDLDAVKHEMCYDLTEKTFTEYQSKLLCRLNEKTVPRAGSLTVTQPRTTVIISVQK